MAKEVLKELTKAGMLPPKSPQYTDPRDFDGGWSSITDDFKFEWAPEKSRRYKKN
jgi:hypothetical protein